jgi:hypothetical protein
MPQEKKSLLDINKQNEWPIARFRVVELTVLAFSDNGCNRTTISGPTADADRNEAWQPFAFVILRTFGTAPTTKR